MDFPPTRSLVWNLRAIQHWIQNITSWELYYERVRPVMPSWPQNILECLAQGYQLLNTSGYYSSSSAIAAHAYNPSIQEPEAGRL